jgi:hypothetical protein
LVSSSLLNLGAADFAGACFAAVAFTTGCFVAAGFLTAGLAGASFSTTDFPAAAGTDTAALLSSGIVHSSKNRMPSLANCAGRMINLF